MGLANNELLIRLFGVGDVRRRFLNLIFAYVEHFKFPDALEERSSGSRTRINSVGQLQIQFFTMA